MRQGRRVPSDAERIEIRRRVAAGQRIADGAGEVARSKRVIDYVVGRAGGLPPRVVVGSGRRLSAVDREEIRRGLRANESFRQIAARLGRAPSSISREVNANDGRRRYRAWRAEASAVRRARRPRVAKLAANPRLRHAVERLLIKLWSPQQIAHWLRQAHPDDQEMGVSHETIDQSVFVQGRGALRAELRRCLRTGRVRRRPAGRAPAGGKLADMILISARPAEIEDRAVPGHWEGDLIVGTDNGSAIGTLVERQTRYLMLFALPHGRTAEAVRTALAACVLRLPAELRRSLTWDQGKEMAEHVRFTIETGVQVYFCDPHSPWQRGRNENTNGLIRQYFPKSTDLSTHTQARLDAVARELNGRPRQTLGWWFAMSRIVAAMIDIV
jgi:transposase, IS30 family